MLIWHVYKNNVGSVPNGTPCTKDGGNSVEKGREGERGKSACPQPNAHALNRVLCINWLATKITNFSAWWNIVRRNAIADVLSVRPSVIVAVMNWTFITFNRHWKCMLSASTIFVCFVGWACNIFRSSRTWKLGPVPQGPFVWFSILQCRRSVVESASYSASRLAGKFRLHPRLS